MIFVPTSRKAALLLAALATLVALVSVTGAADANEFEEFGLESVAAEESSALAGRHPDVTLSFVINHHPNAGGNPVVAARTEELSIALPPGLVGNPAAFPRCTNGEFENGVSCPIDSQVGIVEGLLSGNAEGEVFTEPLYNLEPPHRHDEIASFGFAALFYQVFIDVSVRTGSDYGVTATVQSASGQAPLVSAKTTLWGVPAAPSHDTQRLTPLEALVCGFPCFAGGQRASGLMPAPFTINPTACEEQEVGFTATSYQLPGQVFSAQAPLAPITGCGDLSFQPSLQVEPTNRTAGAPTGLHAVLRIPQTNEVNLPATSALRAAKVTLPEGMTIASGAAQGLEACSDQQVGLGTEVQSNCPQASKLGEATIVSPALPEPLKGAIYQRTPAQGNLFRIWLVTDELGLHLKLPGEIHANPNTGQLSTEFTETPQLPVEEVDLDFWGGPRAPLKNPDACGTYQTHYELTPWSGTPPLSGQTSMTIDEGCARGGFSPQLKAGAANPVAGSFSPLILDLSRADGEERIKQLELTMPKGELARLAGVPLCPEGAAAAGACPAGSQIGSIAAAAGPGDQPLWIPQPGKAPTAVYLAGPYKGAPYSVVTVVPAQAGPFDLGTVVVRGGIYLDPETAQVTVRTDPLPQILEGVPVLYRTLHVAIDRPGFALNPTNCREMSITSSVASVQGTVAHPSDRFQVGECGALKFGPSLGLRLKGASKRGGYPALTATLKTHKREANIRRASVALPHSEFLAQEHIVTVCTRVQFAADSCPAGSVYGHARALTPLLDQPLEGPVYLRSNGGERELPDLVVALHGQLDVDLVGHIDSVNGGIRTTFAAVPDAPVNKFVLKMKGGKKSLLVNSMDICRTAHRATVKMAGQNGRARAFNPRLGGCGGG